MGSLLDLVVDDYMVYTYHQHHIYHQHNHQFHLKQQGKHSRAIASFLSPPSTQLPHSVHDRGKDHDHDLVVLDSPHPLPHHQ